MQEQNNARWKRFQVRGVMLAANGELYEYNNENQVK